MDSGTIYPDGRVRIDGTTPLATRLVGINGKFIAIHYPGGSYSDNGGQHYVPAWVQIDEIAELKPGNEPGTWRFRRKLFGRAIKFHPTPAKASAEAMFDLREHGERFAREVAEGAKT